MKYAIEIVNAFIQEKKATLSDIKKHPMYNRGNHDVSITLTVNVREIESQIKVLQDVKKQMQLTDKVSE